MGPKSAKSRLGLIFVVAVAGYLAWSLLDGNGASRAGRSVVDRQVDPAEDLPEGFIVWGSNRSGDHNIFRMTLPDRRITQLTDHPNVDYHPRLSPDGTRVVFARSRAPGQSTRNQLDWNVVMLDLDTGEEKLLAEYGNFPVWSHDGDKVYYQYRVGQIGAYDLNDEEHRVVFRGGQGQTREGVGFQTPHVSPNGKRFAVTLRFKQHLIGTMDREGNLHRIADGCQLTFSPSGDFLYFIDYGGRMKNAVYVHEPGRGKRQWFDMPGEFSHEYFPKLSQDERYLVFGASRSEKAHEHDTADFEIFLWQVGTPIETAERMTFNEYNDSYPDIHLF